MKIDVTEKSLAEAVERGEWKTAGVTKRERARYESYAKATLRKGRRLTIMLSKKDFDAVQARALSTDVSCETLASVVLHKYTRQVAFGKGPKAIGIELTARASRRS